MSSAIPLIIPKSTYDSRLWRDQGDDCQGAAA